jgi:glycosyltransferase involved in cell wall biosynthesis
MNLAVAVMFLNEEEYLPKLLASVARQSRPPEHLLLVDDGSDDASPAIASRFAERHAYARVLRRPARARSADRLATASELIAFEWAVERLGAPYDVIAKLDGDLELTPRCFERVVAALERDPRLGIAGAALDLRGPDGTLRPERSAPWHVRGATKFYRRECWEQIAPLPPMLGWDTIDEARARMRGWRVAAVELPEGNLLHMRPTGTHDGAIRGFRRRGAAAWAYGAHPVHVVGSALVRASEPPRGLGAAAYLGGWLRAALHREPRAEPELLRFIRTEQRLRLRNLVLRRAGG